MLAESGLAMAFWGEALAALVHVWNQCPTAAVDNATPFKLWHGRKPDVSHFRVWGSTAYVHIQKDKHNVFKPHYEKCVFIGYPDGYKGWKFYNPTTKHTIISERADFNERHTSALHPCMIHHRKPRNGTVEAPHPYTAHNTGNDTADDNPPIALQVLHLGRAPDPHEDQDEDPATPVAQLSLHLSQPYQQLPHLHLSLL